MCRWACATTDTTYMCKWCGTRYCKECLHGDFHGLMLEETKCRKCNQGRCQGVRVEYVPRPKSADDKKGRSRGARGKSASRAGAKTKGKKGGKKKKR